MRRSPPTFALESLVVAVALGVRLPGVWNQPFWEDEVASARILREPALHQVIDRIASTESTPPLWYALAWLAHRAGLPLQEVRLLSVLCGGLLALVAFRLALRLVPAWPATFVGLATGLGSEFVMHGNELRAYALFALLAALFGLCLLRQLAAPSRARELLLAAAVAAGGSTHYFFAFGVASALAWLWLDPGARRIRRRTTLAIGSGSLLALAWLPLARAQYAHARFGWIGSFQLRTVAAVPLRLFSGVYLGRPLGLALSLATACACLAGSIVLARASAPGRAVVALGLGPIVLAGLVWLAGPPVFDFRNLIGVGPFVALAFAAAVHHAPGNAALARRLIPAGVSALLAAAVLTGGGIPAYNVMALSLLRSGWTAADPIAVHGDPSLYRAPLEWYLPHQPTLEIAKPRAGGCRAIFVLDRNGAVTVRRRLGGRRVAPRTWLLVVRGEHPPCSDPSAPTPPAAVALGS